MNLETNDLWQRFIRSQIVPDSGIPALAEKAKQAVSVAESPQAVLEWLLNSRVVTPFQAKILAAGGVENPFVFGEYLILNRCDEGPLKGSYPAIHRPTGHLVDLDFIVESTKSDGLIAPQRSAVDWIDRAESVAQVPNECLIPVHEVVVLPEHTFVVSERCVGTALGNKVPPKGRLPWQAAITLAVPIAEAIVALEERGLCHGEINPMTIWLEPKQKTRLRMNWQASSLNLHVPAIDGESLSAYQSPEVVAGEKPTTQSDLYALGRVLTRLITGRLPPEKVPPGDATQDEGPVSTIDWEKYKLPPEAESLIQKLTLPKASDRNIAAQDVVVQLKALSDTKPEESLKADPDTSLVRYRKHLAAAKTFWVSPIVLNSEPIEVNAEAQDEVAERRANREPVRIEDHQLEAQKRRRQQFIWTMAAVLGFGALTMFVIWSLGSQQIKRPDLSKGEDGVGAESGAAVKGESSMLTTPTAAIKDLPPNAALNQFLVPDDSQLLWESPTNGSRLAIQYLPPNPRIIFSCRLSDMVQSTQGSLAMKSLAPELLSTIENWRQASGLELEDIQQLILGLYDDGKNYQSVSVVILNQQVELRRLLSLWNAEQVEIAGENSLSAYARGDNLFWPISSGTEGQLVSGFVMAPQNLLTQALEIGTANSLDGVMATIAKRVDGDRHFNALFLSSALFNDQGQALMSGRWSVVNRSIREVMNEYVRGGIFSLHFEQNEAYLELTFEHSTDIKPKELMEVVRAGLQTSSNKIIDFAASMPNNPYWNSARQRFDNMVDGVMRFVRVGAEQGFVVSNAWVPAASIHNIIATADLALAFSGGVDVMPTASGPTPKTLEQVLSSTRRLEVTTNPDLNVLLQNLQTEINADFPTLESPFEIKINGNDLVVEGITQNQRPGDFQLEDVTVAAILTEIVFRANPDKAATSPADERCKLVWVVIDDPENPNRRIIQITTRQAAISREWELPAVFRVDKE